MVQLNGREIFVREDREDFELLQRPESKQRRAVPITRLPGKQPREGRHQSGNAQQGVPGAKVFVNNLSWQTTWQTLKDHFNTQGLVAYAAVLTVGHCCPLTRLHLHIVPLKCS